MNGRPKHPGPIPMAGSTQSPSQHTDESVLNQPIHRPVTGRPGFYKHIFFNLLIHFTLKKLMIENMPNKYN